MHQPFPSSEIFRCLTYREELLRGMLCADHIGFHLFEWARNFLSSCRRLLSCTYEVRRGGGLTVHYQGRAIALTCSHMGIEPELLQQIQTSAGLAKGLRHRRAASATSMPTTPDVAPRRRRGRGGGGGGGAAGGGEGHANGDAANGRATAAAHTDDATSGETTSSDEDDPGAKANGSHGISGGGDDDSEGEGGGVPLSSRLAVSHVRPGLYRSVVSGSVSADNSRFTLDAEQLRREHEGYTCFGSIDVLEGLKGVPLKLLAFEHLLHASKRETAAKLRLLLIGMIPDARPDDHARCKAEVLALIERINAAFPGSVHFRECRAFDLASRLALWSVTEIFVVTSVREGLNLLPIEFLLAREHSPGVLVLSEFCSLARILSSSIVCNPWSVRKVSAALQRAVQLAPDARAQRAAADLRWCSENTARVWAKRMLDDVEAASKRKLDDGLNEDERGGAGGGLGLGLGWRPPARLGMGLVEGRGFSRLREDELLADYRKATRRLLVLDHIGTLVPSPYVHEQPEGLTYSRENSFASPTRSSSNNLGGTTPGGALDGNIPVGGLADLLSGTTDTGHGGGGGGGGMDGGVPRSGSMGGGAGGAPMPPSASYEWLSMYGGFGEGDVPVSGLVNAGAAGHPVRERPRGCLPSASVRNSLEVLCADSRNTLLVMSTGSTEELSAAYGSVPGCSLCADNGLHVAWSGLHGRWEMAGGVAWELSEAAKRAPMENWRELALSIMAVYSERTNGSYVEQSSSGLTFVYGACDPEFGSMQAKELHAHLSEALEPEFAVELHLRPGRLHVQPKGVDKGGLLRQAIEAAQPDFVLVLGDDHSDEPAFAALADWLKESKKRVTIAIGGGAEGGGSGADGGGGGGGGGGAAPPRVAYGVTVGKKPSCAAHFVDDQSAAAGLLETLKWGSLRGSKTSTSADGLVALDSRRSSSSDGLAPTSTAAQPQAPGGQPVWAVEHAIPGVRSSGSSPPQGDRIATSSLLSTPKQKAGGGPPPIPEAEDRAPLGGDADGEREGLTKASEGGCPYRQDELTSAPPTYRVDSLSYNSQGGGAQLTLTLPSVASAAVSALLASLAVLALRAQRGRRKLLYTLLTAVLAVPRWRAALVRALELARVLA